MCEASVYLLKDGREEFLLDSVDILEPQEGGKIYMRNLAGEQKVLTARIKGIRLVEHKIILEKTEG
ncbi:MAG: RNA-binding protein [Nitrospirae bacterium RIFCSPLOW2_12_42_9]|nr:MAG: RNA-binding protein [Nitrospirae bacterium GWA2_42_11]OGW58745.1 MAG: RNA-binding protein [Nitrospirae bacterium RIFCSPHIGHO2_02_FULL_42_12]OGW59737.1 MAG: RNA-binding protein [Nitrospirae bacterium RIFCSPLOW2_12_42_9]HBI23891.1 RNA-binding protein [Nitrospiraceae bacterium]